MQIFLNGEPQDTTCQNLLQLIQELSLEGKRFAVEMNEMIISKSKLEQTPIAAQDRIEIIHAVGGG
ncbi:sulfur carrier protein ThiS [Acinetobacter sichuanensis]|uniref:Sulfur carrier protein ThiS n=1 Tax=Acinetobacter sichuanensis TaxID=2136183 RepID=A0A371YSL1_9GAMM|nr:MULTISPECIES: sulfur carrier protein ThiS [Acinetobacter]MDM1247407.1 sulfur carrier protein ThiS [Acinetobacter sp. R933-2]MDM1763173.1 sulfur carrier protein ThiS [Acinetobacter sp. 226-1]MDM1766652.1 sulfur carrier protein ThiS [Acinetobacter sp. 226-4]MDQ9020193.1 sulfur carrier protein ThiS [Acinetobacter sichuanensis]RFC84458.1 sulfur carrier protein ThiS [Acinetobacter sichuanensis]